MPHAPTALMLLLLLLLLLFRQLLPPLLEYCCFRCYCRFHCRRSSPLCLCLCSRRSPDHGPHDAFDSVFDLLGVRLCLLARSFQLRESLCRRSVAGSGPYVSSSGALLLSDRCFAYWPPRCSRLVFRQTNERHRKSVPYMRC